MSYSTAITIIYGVRTTRNVPEDELRAITGSSDLCDYSAGNGLSGKAEHYVAIGRTVQTFDTMDQYSLQLEPFGSAITPEEVRTLEAVPDQVPASEGWHILAYYG